MQKLTILLTTAAMLLLGLNQAARADEVEGIWLTAAGDAKIRISSCGKALCGIIVWLKAPIDPATGKPQIDDKNTNKALAQRPIVGINIFNAMRSVADKKWSGTIYNADDGKTYSSDLQLAGTKKLEVRGCVLAVLCGGETWTRVGPPIPVSAAGNPAPAGAPAAKGALPKPAAPQKTTGAVAPAAKPAQKQAATPPGTANASADTVGDICLLPDIARPTH